jgi:hypothetical protein
MLLLLQNCCFTFLFHAACCMLHAIFSAVGWVATLSNLGSELSVPFSFLAVYLIPDSRGMAYCKEALYVCFKHINGGLQQFEGSVCKYTSEKRIAHR